MFAVQLLVRFVPESILRAAGMRTPSFGLEKGPHGRSSFSISRTATHAESSVGGAGIGAWAERHG